MRPCLSVNTGLKLIHFLRQDHTVKEPQLLAQVTDLHTVIQSLHHFINNKLYSPSLLTLAANLHAGDRERHTYEIKDDKK